MTHEIITDILDGDDWWRVIRIALDLMKQNGVHEVQLEYGFVIDLDTEGLPQGVNRAIPLNQLEETIRTGLIERTIERRAGSDFSFIGDGLEVMLCNDDDIHFKSQDVRAIRAISEKLKAAGFTVHGGQ